VDVADDDGAALGEGGFALGVAEEEAVELFAGVEAVDADVDEGCAGLDHFRGDEAGAADGGDEDVGLAGDLGEVSSFGVANGDRGVVVEQEHGGGLADDVAAADDDGVLAGDGNDSAALEDFDDAGGGAGGQSRGGLPEDGPR
jgi:hypothetical protein